MADGRPGVTAVRPGYLLAALAAVAGLAAAGFAAGVSGRWSADWLLWLPPPVGALLAAAACRQAAAALPAASAGRTFWARLAVAVGVLGAGTVANAWDALSGPAPTQRVGPLTLAAYLAGVLLVVWAITGLPLAAARTPADWLRLGLDAAVVLLATGLFTWYVTHHAGPDWPFFTGTLSATMAVVASGLIGTLACLRAAQAGPGPVDRRALRLLGATVAVGALAGALAPLWAPYPYLNSAQLVVPVTGLLLALAAARQWRAGAEPVAASRPRSRPCGLVPYAAVAAASGLLLVTAPQGGTHALVVAFGTILLIGLVVLRQVVTFRDNARLRHRVDASLEELEEVQRQLAFHARHDVLTGLANRRHFEEATQQALDRGEPVTVALVDLDDFKSINDRLGHTVGDSLLAEVGRRLRTCVRASDTVARLGGDEFALLLRGVSANETGGVLERISAALAKPVPVDGHDLLVGSSIGLAEAWPGANPGELLRRADLAMYAAKDRGKGGHARYDLGLDRQAEGDAQLGAELRQGLDRGEFHLLYQPVVRLPGGETVGVEALVRWQQPERGLVRPDLFIGAAERTGLIVPLGAWILREACRQAAQWHAAYGPDRDWEVGVNISARQLREHGFADRVARVLAETGLPANRLIIEVTETAVFDNEAAVAALADICALGVRVALDDFGTGHSSLGLLRSTPVHVLKVDKSFIDGITETSEEAVIATAMIQIADGLHLGAVAEGVETQAQADRLHQLGYRVAQGFLFGRPLPPEQAGPLLGGGRLVAA
ncbi:MAG TPA: bifunctional diguanylate cyclase/phosphodiesterase [Pilimelia sp.]|nr:bifunctional diguanylate cyclase/phosphodiesterase [Pilimelia sp.]